MTVDIPLLRKGLEWAEAEAAKPIEDCEWHQGRWKADPKDLTHLIRIDPETSAMVITDIQKSASCGTCFCLAGYLMNEAGIEFNNIDGSENEDKASELLGITPTQGRRLFAGGNSIKDLRTIAETIAGERL